MGMPTLKDRVTKIVLDSTSREACVDAVVAAANVDIQLLHTTLVRTRELMSVYPVIPRAQELYDTVDSVLAQYQVPGTEKVAKKPAA